MATTVQINILIDFLGSLRLMVDDYEKLLGKFVWLYAEIWFNKWLLCRTSLNGYDFNFNSWYKKTSLDSLYVYVFFDEFFPRNLPN